MGGALGLGIHGGGLFFVIRLLTMGGMIVGWIIFLVAMWRGMKAHESMAQSLQRMAEKK